MTIQLRRQFQTLMTRQGRRVIAVQALAVALALALLLVPTTCAQVSGPHSIFLDTSGSHVHHHDPVSEDDGGFASNNDLAWHVVLGDASPTRILSDAATQDDLCPTSPQLREMPETMAMGSAGAPMSIDIVDAIEIPLPDEPIAHETPALTAIEAPVESPPPRCITG